LRTFTSKPRYGRPWDEVNGQLSCRYFYRHDCGYLVVLTPPPNGWQSRPTAPVSPVGAVPHDYAARHGYTIGRYISTRAGDSRIVMLNNDERAYAAMKMPINSNGTSQPATPTGE